MYSPIDTMWVMFAITMVFFMQAGFCMLETGFTRQKNAGNVIMKNFIDFALGTLVFWFIGYGLMYGGTDPFIGTFDPFIMTVDNYNLTIPPSTFILFQAVFCATSSTIVSGAMAERTKFSSYCIYSLVLCAIIYPISGHWIWGGGFLQQIGFHDFAGSTAIHLVGGVAALCGAKILGARIGKFSKDGTPRAIPGHSLTLGALGVFILWFGWFGFNSGSTLSINSSESAILVSNIFINTNIAAATATITAMIITWLKYKKPDISMTLNGGLAGLVAITAGCDQVSPFGAFFIGIIAAFVVIYGIEFVENKLKIDDPVGAVGVHGMCGATGTLLVGIFSTSSGLLYGFGFHQLFIQLFGIIVVALWVSITMSIVYITIKKTIGLRVTEEEELGGLDIFQHGVNYDYTEFMPSVVSSVNNIITSEQQPIAHTQNNPIISNYDKPKITKIVIITSNAKFELLKSALDNIGITGMTVTHVLGCGLQKGRKELYRGSALETTLLPKVKVEIVVCNVPAQTVIDTAKSVLHTGNIGDGKIFVYDTENVIKVRTGEEGKEALLDIE